MRVFFRVFGGALDCTLVNCESPDCPFWLYRQTRRQPGPCASRLARRLVDVQLGEDSDADFHQLVVFRRLAVEMDAAPAVDRLDFRLLLVLAVLGEGERSTERDAHLAAADLGVLFAVVDLRADVPVKQGHLAVEVHLARPVDVKGGRPLGLSRLGRLFDGKLEPTGAR